MFKHAYVIVPIRYGLRRNTSGSIVAKSCYGLKELHLVATCATCWSSSSHSSLLVRGIRTRTPDDSQEHSNHNIDCQEETTTIPDGASTRNKVDAKTRIDWKTSKSDLQAPILEKETFEGWMVEVQEAMEQGNLPLKESRKRARAWKVGRGLEDEDDNQEEAKEVDSVKEEDRKVHSYESHVGAGPSERRKDGTRDEASSNAETREDATRPNPYLNYVLPVYHPVRCGYRRLADLSFIEADARLGLFTELYNSPFPWQRRGGQGELTKKWDDILAVRRWEKTTGEKAIWMRSTVEERAKELRTRRKESEARNRES